MAIPANQKQRRARAKAKRQRQRARNKPAAAPVKPVTSTGGGTGPVTKPPAIAQPPQGGFQAAPSKAAKIASSLPSESTTGDRRYTDPNDPQYTLNAERDQNIRDRTAAQFGTKADELVARRLEGMDPNSAAYKRKRATIMDRFWNRREGQMEDQIARRIAGRETDSPVTGLAPGVQRNNGGYTPPGGGGNDDNDTSSGGRRVDDDDTGSGGPPGGGTTIPPWKIPPEEPGPPYDEEPIEIPEYTQDPMPGPEQLLVGQDPFSQLIAGGIGTGIENAGDVTGGYGQFGEVLKGILGDVGERGSASEELAGLIERGGDYNPEIAKQRQMGLQDALEVQRRQMERQRYSQMGARGLLGSGDESRALAEMDRELYNPAAQAMAGWAGDEAQRADQRYMEGLGLEQQGFQKAIDQLMQGTGQGVGIADSQNQALQNYLKLGGDRQQMLGDQTQRNLESNMAWNKFLAEFGLDRDIAMEEITNNRLGALLPMLSQFLQAANLTQGGYK